MLLLQREMFAHKVLRDDDDDTLNPAAAVPSACNLVAKEQRELYEGGGGLNPSKSRNERQRFPCVWCILGFQFPNKC